MLERSKRYVGNARFFVMMNYEQFDTSKYGEDTVQKKSKIISRQFSTKHPTFAMMETSLDYIEDETSFLNLGQY